MIFFISESDDGKETVGYPFGSLYSGSSGAWVWLFQKNEDTFKLLQEFFCQEIKIARTKTNGCYDLYLYIKSYWPQGGWEILKVKYIWNGFKYEKSPEVLHLPPNALM